MTSTGGAGQLPVADRTSSAVKLPRTRNAVDSGRRVYVPSPSPQGTRLRTPRSRASWREGRTGVGRTGPGYEANRSSRSRAEADSRAEMPRIADGFHLTRVAAAAGLAAFAAVTLFAPQDGGPQHVLQHLGVRRADGARVRDRRIARVPRQRERVGMDGDHRRARPAGRSGRSGTPSSSRRRIPRWPTRGSSRSTSSSTSASYSCSAHESARSPARCGSTESQRRSQPPRSEPPSSSTSSSRTPRARPPPS